MAVGQDIAVLSIDDDAGAGRLRLALLGLRALRQVEKAAEKRILQQRVLGPHLAAHRDVDDPRSHPRQHRREGRHRATHLGDRAGRDGGGGRGHEHGNAAHQDERG